LCYSTRWNALVQTRGLRCEAGIRAAQFLDGLSCCQNLTRLHVKGSGDVFSWRPFSNRLTKPLSDGGRFDVLLCMGPPTTFGKNWLIFPFCVQEAEKEPEESKKAAESFSKKLAAAVLQLKLNWSSTRSLNLKD